jgi:hypothetical protein
MTRQADTPDYCETLEYHGGTIIERTRRHRGRLIRREWLIFDSLEEADAFFNETAVA